MKRMKHFTTVFCMSLALTMSANNIQVSNVSIASQDTVSQTAQIQFDISWENSWRIDVGPSNWDAAWIFVKFKMADYQAIGASSSGTTITTSTTARLRVGMRVELLAGNGSLAYDTYVTGILGPTQFTISKSPSVPLVGAVLRGTDLWEHAWISNSGAVIPAGAQFELGLLDPSSPYHDTTNPGLGGFLYRDTNGNGTFTNSGVQLRWDYGSQGVPNNDIVDIKVFAVEMVYIPKGPFNLGGGGGFSAFTQITIDTAKATLAGAGTGAFGGLSGGHSPIFLGNPSADTWPNRYNAYYMMKYEISQGQYVDFLNTLTRDKQDKRVNQNVAVGSTLSNPIFVMGNNSGMPVNRNGVVNNPAGPNEQIIFGHDLNNNGVLNEPDDGEWVACNWLNNQDLLTFLDWAALRPMTEYEFEKAARGAEVFPIGGEYAWGSTGLVQATALDSAGRATEVASDTLANASYGNGLTGPYRVGGLAYASSTRTRAGAGYHGAMDLSGNVLELAVCFASGSIGPSYNGVHGNGMLQPVVGIFDVVDWGYNIANPTNPNSTLIVGARGGRFNGAIGDLGVSDRKLHSNLNQVGARRLDNGGRGVRTAQP